MILIRIWGGLGNQMFQYATAYALSIDYETKLGICLDRISKFGKEAGTTVRQFDLERVFTLKNTEFVPTKMLSFYEGVSSSIADKLKYKLGQYYSYHESSLRFDDQIFKLGKNSLIDGYFQSEKYFQHQKKRIEEAFAFDESRLNEQSKDLAQKISERAVAMHIRRGDYVQDEAINKIHGTCSIEYYEKGLEILKENSFDQLVIFSDDPEWVKSNMKFDVATIYVDWNSGLDDWQDMYLMSLCSHFVIANSSFSWWGAWLAKNENKRVIAPKSWFNDKKKNDDTEDLIPADWLRI